jgi:hypothetical protein
MSDFFSHQLVTMRLLLLQTCTNPAMSTNELERHHIRSLLIPERLNLFKCLEFPAVASDAPVAIFAMHDLPHELCYSQLLPGQVKSRTTCPKEGSRSYLQSDEILSNGLGGRELPPIRRLSSKPSVEELARVVGLPPRSDPLAPLPSFAGCGTLSSMTLYKRGDIW